MSSGIAALITELHRRARESRSWHPTPRYVAEAGGQMVGMVAVGALGSIPLVMIHPHRQRRGIGRRLVETARRHLQAAGLPAITLGSGGDRYIWQGVAGPVRIDARYLLVVAKAL